mmetsp:Transcript_5482/g.15692  ORF Transcript_5482/g.15692 Transcript_5482/m.15692 type:complete len:297 (+) Transcript_5482:319-1209(+)
MAKMGLAALETVSHVRLTQFIRCSSTHAHAQRPLLTQPPSASRQLRCRQQIGRCSAALEADFGQPSEAFAAFEGSFGDASFGEGCEVNPGAQRQRQSSSQQPLAARLRDAARNALCAVKRAQRFAKRFALYLAKAMVLGVALRLSQRRSLSMREQALQKQSDQKQAARMAALEAAAAQRAEAQARIERAEKRRSRADRAYTDMLLQQDDPERSLDSKWRDLTTHMRSKRAPEFRRRAATLFSAALDASHAVQVAINTEAVKGSKALDQLVAKHDCVAEEEALRSHIFASLLNAQQS